MLGDNCLGENVRKRCPMCEVLRSACVFVPLTGAVPAMKPEATAVGDPQDGRW